MFRGRNYKWGNDVNDAGEIAYMEYVYVPWA